MVRRVYPQRSVIEVLLPDADKLWDPILRRIDTLLDVVLFSMTGLLSLVALFLPGTTHDYAIRQAGPSILSRDVLGTPGDAMLQALVQSTSDPAILAELCVAAGGPNSRLCDTRSRVTSALTTRSWPFRSWRTNHLEGAVATLSERIAAIRAPFAGAVQRLDTIPGVNQRTAEVLIAKIGGDVSRF